MEIYGEISKVRAAVKAWKKEGLTVGFVPTDVKSISCRIRTDHGLSA